MPPKSGCSRSLKERVCLWIRRELDGRYAGSVALVRPPTLILVGRSPGADRQ